MASEGEYRARPGERSGAAHVPSDHPTQRRILYFLVGMLAGLAGGFSNALLMANLPQLQGLLGITPVGGGWLVVAHATGGVCMGLALIRLRHRFGLTRFVRVVLTAFILLGFVQLIVQAYPVALVVRALGGMAGMALSVLALFYILEAMPPNARLGGLVIGIGITQIAHPLARLLSAFLLWEGGGQNLLLFELGMALAALGAMSLWRLPPVHNARAFEQRDYLTLALFVPGVALLCAFLVLGRIVWWDTAWIGLALAGAVALLGAALLFEHNRFNPLLNIRWIGAGAILRIIVLAVAMRLLLSDALFGMAAPMHMLEAGNDPLILLYALVTLAAMAGLVISLLTLDPADLVRPVLFAILLILIAAGLGSRPDLGVTHLQPSVNLHIGWMLAAFAALFLMAPALVAVLRHALARGPAHVAAFAALFFLAQALGGLAGTVIFDSFRTLRERVHLGRITESLSPDDPWVVEQLRRLEDIFGGVLAGPAELEAQADLMLQQLASREAVALAYNDLFLLVVCLALSGLVALGGRWVYDRRMNRAGLGLAARQKQKMESSP